MSADLWPWVAVLGVTFALFFGTLYMRPVCRVCGRVDQPMRRCWSGRGKRCVDIWGCHAYRRAHEDAC